ncbi:MAG TPA: hypothetical protein PKH05_01020 [Nitrospira sp.]|nr:hypothetical protein [Nitrospira sp.]
MTPEEFTHARLSLGLTQHALADQLKRKRLAIVRYESGARRIPGVVEVVLQSLGSLSFVPLVGIVAAEDPIELILQAEQVEVPRSMMGTGDTVALRIKEGGHVGMPLSFARRLCPSLHVRPPDPPRAEAADASLRTVIRRYAPTWEPVTENPKRRPQVT